MVPTSAGGVHPESILPRPPARPPLHPPRQYIVYVIGAGLSADGVHARPYYLNIPDPLVSACYGVLVRESFQFHLPRRQRDKTK